MADNVIDLEAYRNSGNGARDVLIDHMASYAASECDLHEIIDFIDTLLARLWLEGYKVVPLTEEDRAPEPPLYA